MLILINIGLGLIIFCALFGGITVLGALRKIRNPEQVDDRTTDKGKNSNPAPTRAAAAPITAKKKTFLARANYLFWLLVALAIGTASGFLCHLAANN